MKSTFILLAYIVCTLLLFVANILFTDTSPTMISYRHVAIDLNEESVLTDNNNLSYSITAKENYLGAVVVGLKAEQLLDGTVTLTVHDDSGEVIAKNSYDSKDFYYLSPYPFGFPIINDSIGKKYTFVLEFEPSDQHTQSELFLSSNVVIGEYKYPKEVIFSSASSTLNFLIRKVIYSMQIDMHTNLLILYLFSIVALIAIMFGNICLVFRKLRVYITKNLLARVQLPLPNYSKIVFILIIAYLFIPLNADLGYVFGMFVWILYLRYYHLNSQSTFAHVLVLLIPAAILILLESPNADQIVSIIFTFVGMYFVQLLWEYDESE